MPGSRNSRHPDEKFYERFGVRVIVPDGPGYGASTRLAGRGISMVADDAAELLDHLGLDAVSVSGGSAGGPHALAFATLAVLAPWDFDPSDVGCSLTWWHGEHDRNTPISAVRRLVAGFERSKLCVWTDGGHLQWYHRHDEILAELVSR